MAKAKSRSRHYNVRIAITTRRWASNEKLAMVSALAFFVRPWVTTFAVSCFLCASRNDSFSGFRPSDYPSVSTLGQLPRSDAPGYRRRRPLLDKFLLLTHRRCAPVALL